MRPMLASSTPITFNFVAIFEPVYPAFGSAPVSTLASTFVCSHSGATRP